MERILAQMNQTPKIYHIPIDTTQGVVVKFLPNLKGGLDMSKKGKLILATALFGAALFGASCGGGGGTASAPQQQAM